MKRVAVAEGQRVADDGPENGDQAHHGEALHHGAEDVLAAHQAAVEERQAGAGHQQDQGGGDQHPGVVAGGLRVLDGLLEGGDLGLGCGSLCCGLRREPGPGRGRDRKGLRVPQELERLRILIPLRKNASPSYRRGRGTGLCDSAGHCIRSLSKQGCRSPVAVQRRPPIDGRQARIGMVLLNIEG